jgi:hypothetical protein
MRQLQETFPGHSAFTPSNSVKWRRSSKYATSERDEYATSEQGFSCGNSRGLAGQPVTGGADRLRTTDRSPDLPDGEEPGRSRRAQRVVESRIAVWSIPEEKSRIAG